MVVSGPDGSENGDCAANSRTCLVSSGNPRTSLVSSGNQNISVLPILEHA